MKKVCIIAAAIFIISLSLLKLAQFNRIKVGEVSTNEFFSLEDVSKRTVWAIITKDNDVKKFKKSLIMQK